MTWIKICGMTSAAAVSAALEARVDALGFVFARSPREVTPEAAARLAQSARGRAICVAVTRHPDQHVIDEIVRVFRPDLLQTDVDDLSQLRLPGELSVLPVLRGWKAEGAPKARDGSRAESIWTDERGALPERVLFEGQASGAGVIGDWSAARLVARRTQLVLAGGLNPANVGQALAEVRPHGVDVSSGVESSPGVKSPAEIERFVAAVRRGAQAAPPNR